MPTYEYRCAGCGHELELFQNISEAPKRKCPACKKHRLKRCGISMKGIDIVVRGSVGHLSAFMAQTGRLVVCGDAGEALGDSIYEAHIYVRGEVAGLGADCVEKELRPEHAAELRELLERAGMDDVDPADFNRYGSARQLYNFKVDNAGAY